MTETITRCEPPQDDPAGSDVPIHPSDILLDFIVAFLAPMFLGASGGDICFARMAALETVNAYRARDQTDLIAIAQIIACGLTALGSLSLSMADNLSLSMTLRLRGNAVALNRSAEQNRRAPDIRADVAVDVGVRDDQRGRRIHRRPQEPSPRGAQDGVATRRRAEQLRQSASVGRRSAAVQIG